jgi:hypothetical protein
MQPHIASASYYSTLVHKASVDRPARQRLQIAPRASTSTRSVNIRTDLKGDPVVRLLSEVLARFLDAQLDQTGCDRTLIRVAQVEAVVAIGYERVESVRRSDPRVELRDPLFGARIKSPWLI